MTSICGKLTFFFSVSGFVSYYNCTLFEVSFSVITFNTEWPFESTDPFTPGDFSLHLDSAWLWVCVQETVLYHRHGYCLWKHSGPVGLEDNEATLVPAFRI